MCAFGKSFDLLVRICRTAEQFKRSSLVGGIISISQLWKFARGYSRPLRWHKLIALVNHTTHTPLLPFCNEYLNKHTYIPRFLTLSRKLLLAWSYTWLRLCQRKCNFGHYRLYLLYMQTHSSHSHDIVDEKISKKKYLLHALDVVFYVRLLGTQKWRGVSTLMHLCSQTDDTPPDLSVHLPPQSRFTALFSTALFARGALFSSVLNELNGRTAKKHCSFHIPDIAECLRLGYV